MTEIFEVGGCVRDEIMGITPKDIDFSVVTDSFETMEKVVSDAGMKVVQRKPEFGTILAVARQPFRGHTGGLDFVWARVDGPSSDGRRPDWTRPGNLSEDLSRRDFTCNAIAKDEQGNLIDPFNGVQDIQSGIIRCVGNALDRMNEDPLRAIRALRFAVTKGFWIDPSVDNAIRVVSHKMHTVSKERQREEMEKMFSFDTVASMDILAKFPTLRDAIFSDGLRLMPTMKKG